MIAGLRPYPAYRDSGVEWLGEVPAHWDVSRLCNVVDLRVSNVDKHTKEDETPVRLCNYTDVYKNDRIRSGMPFMAATATQDEMDRFRLRPGDVLITKDSEAWDDIGVPAFVQEADEDLLSGYHLALLRPALTRLEGEFLFRALESRGIGFQLHVQANGVTRYGLSHHAIKSVRVPVPPLPEQAAIARFLDDADRRIQRAIRAKEKRIALLEEQKQALIQEAVTGQIDVRTGKPYPAYKDSGVVWVGEIPEHWSLRHLGRVGRLFKGGGGTKEDDQESGVPCVRYGDLYTQHRFFISASRACVAPERAATAYTSLRYGDVLFAGSGETIDEIGKSAVNLIRGSACCGGDVIVFRPSIRADARFLGYVSDCPASARQKACMGLGFTVMHIYSSDLKYLAIPLPPVPEQTAIADFLDTTTQNLKSVAAAHRHQIQHMKEYRARLFADVVTGKLDVREAAASLPDADPLAPDENDRADPQPNPTGASSA